MRTVCTVFFAFSLLASVSTAWAQSDCSSDDVCRAHANVESRGTRCDNAQCVYVCKQGYADCDATPGCETSLSSQQHCGACGLSCDSDRRCERGTCVCASGLQSCGELCVDTGSSAAHCGGCERSCASHPHATAASQCSQGACVYSCEPGWGDCGAEDGCESSLESQKNCGQCGVVCGAGKACQGGVCQCPAAAPLDCAGKCINPSNDNENCGACGVSCEGERRCQNGSCVCPSGKTDCGSSCVNLQSDAKHCGACAQDCSSHAHVSPKSSCAEGVCAYVCEAGWADCDASPGCETSLDSERHCGACNNSCSGGKQCSKGRCLCPSGQVECDGVCIEPQSDVRHCGRCSNDCLSHPHAGPNTTCAAGACVYVCEASWGDCGSASGCETSLQSDKDCGACGVKCEGGKSCRDGRCVCPEGERDCDGVCKQVLVDPKNCGACGTVCSGGKRCEQGSCVCPPGQSDCAGVCKTLAEDAEHCGACGNDCRSHAHATAKSSCQVSECRYVCDAAWGDCDAQPGCETSLDSEQNCGACGVSCSGGKVCKGGKCQCPPGQSDCNGVCVDLQSAQENCGACGKVCSGGKLCQKGRCECPSGQSDCGGVCQELQSDVEHCGSCKNNCLAHPHAGPNTSCAQGACVYVCEASWGDCSSSTGCETSLETMTNCGACGVSCKGGMLCERGRCVCPDGELDCAGQCKKVNSDSENCGTCGVRCSGGMSCQQGRCVCPDGQDDCDGVCKSLQKDVEHCGACGNDCRAHVHVSSKTSCAAGVCDYVCDSGWGDCSSASGCETSLQSDDDCGVCGKACSGGKRCDGGTCRCPSGLNDCDGQCRDLRNDDGNCGGCGKLCTGGKSCNGGSCVCPTGEKDCSGTCRDLARDSSNCGACGKSCSGGKVCIQGDCVCPEGESDCGGVCRNLRTDPDNCGTCGERCASHPNTVQSGHRCAAAGCAYACVEGWGDCSPEPGCESSLATDEHCGACGVACQGGKRCDGQRCVCPEGETDCSGVCHNLRFDDDNCGACAQACAQSDRCEEGSCVVAVYMDLSPGRFTMGSPENELGHRSDELQREVSISRRFELKTTEVTQAEWQSLMGFNPSRACAQSEAPVDSVSWYDALAYCNALSSAEELASCYDLSGCLGKPGEEDYRCPYSISVSLDCEGYRLPTEAEWEYAARAGTQSAIWSGDLKATGCTYDATLAQTGNYCGNVKAPAEVSTLAANPWMLFDINGNVAEWVWDSYGSYQELELVDPVCNHSELSRVFRGGSYESNAEDCRNARRSWASPSFRSTYVGLRPARTLRP
ncbi:MAG: SUMF1/EgtB/PvdO family nonheme iron enzyme [Myxococcota bacterium]|nr:SUMF1/EgtB/PvdO family nonheme iron enzyme [Myxococcota bacterium]